MGTSSREPPREPGSAEPERRPGLRAAIEAVLPAARFGDERVILAGTGQNVIGLVVAVVATFVAQVLITRFLGPAAYGVITVATQTAFVGAAATRFGMDMAAVRRVAIELGRGERARVRAVVARAAGIATLVSAAAAVGLLAAGDLLGEALTSHAEGPAAFRAAAAALPVAALVQVYLGGTRGLKVMRHTLWIFWVGQHLSCIALMLLFWWAGPILGLDLATPAGTVLAYAGSWALATGGAAWAWRRETRGFGQEPPEPGETRELLRYGAPRAPAALFTQLIFWADLYVLARLASSFEVGVYAAAVRAAQVILLFLASVNLMFSPFVADLYARGDRDRLGALYKSLTRWVLAASIPIIVVLVSAPGPILRLFGGEFEAGRTALVILAVGQLVNVATGSVGFILIMVGRTGWDLAVQAAALALDVLVAATLIPHLGMRGAAVAGAVTMAISNVARLALVRRFVGIQPYTRDYLRLLWPTVAALAAGWVAGRVTSGAAWQIQLVAVGGGAGAVYAAVLVAVGLRPAERRALAGLITAVRGRRGPAT